MCVSHMPWYLSSIILISWLNHSPCSSRKLRRLVVMNLNVHMSTENLKVISLFLCNFQAYNYQENFAHFNKRRPCIGLNFFDSVKCGSYHKLFLLSIFHYPLQEFYLLSIQNRRPFSSKVFTNYFISPKGGKIIFSHSTNA